MKKGLLLKIMSALLCVCLLAGTFAGCSGNKGKTEVPLQGTAGVSNDEKVELVNMRKDSAGTFYVITKRGTSSSTNTTSDFYLLNNSFGDLYPGAVVNPNTSKPTATQELIASDELERKPLSLDIKIKNGDSTSVSVDNPDSESVSRYVKKALKGFSGSAATSVRYCMIDKEKDFETKLGIKYLDNIYKVDFKDIAYGRFQYMFVVFDQVYYTANAKPQNASELYADSVSKQTLSDSGVDTAAEITSVDYGRRVIVRIKTAYASDNNAILERSITNQGFTETGLNATYNVFAIGGSSGEELEWKNIYDEPDKVNKAINSELDFNKDLTAIPLSYKMNKLKDGSQLTSSVDVENFETFTDVRKQFKVTFDPATAYNTSDYKFYARKIKDVNSDGSYVLGPWVCLRHDGNTTKNSTIYIDGEYAEFAFSFNTTGGTKWPYTDVFYTSDKPAPNDIYIEWGGTSYNTYIEITVNGKRVVDQSNCSSHSERQFA